jgi:hypothetical protein
VKLDIPEGLIPFAREFSRPKTPHRRTQGFAEQQGHERGEGDMLDTVGSLMLWKYLVDNGVPATYLLTALQGDEADLKTGPVDRTININVKTSKWQQRGRDNPCQVCHLTVKRVEFDKLPDVFVQVMVQLAPEGGERPHVHLCGWISTRSDAFRKQKEQEIPNTGGSRGLWIASADFTPIQALPSFLARGASVAVGEQRREPVAGAVDHFPGERARS